MFEKENPEPEHALGPVAVARVEAWRGRMNELASEELRAFWAEAVAFARWEIGRYRRWLDQDEPVLPDGYDAEGVVQAAFERLMYREAVSAPIFYSAEDVRRELRILVKHRVRWLHERSEARLVLGEWDVLPPMSNGELVSVFDFLPGRIGKPDEELMRKEREQLLGKLKAGFEATLGAELLEVFGKAWEGQKRREIARGLEVGVERVKASRAQLRRRAARFGSRAAGEILNFDF